MKNRSIIFFGLLCTLFCLVLLVVAVSYNTQRLTETRAQQLIQYYIASESPFPHEITNVQLGFRLCGPQDSGSIACKIDVTLLLDGEPRVATCVDNYFAPDHCTIPLKGG